MSKYIVKHFAEIFREEFLIFLTPHICKNGFTPLALSKIMEKVEEYEKRSGFEFVTFHNDSMIIFKQAEQ